MVEVIEMWAEKVRNIMWAPWGELARRVPETWAQSQIWGEKSYVDISTPTLLQDLLFSPSKLIIFSSKTYHFLLQDLSFSPPRPIIFTNEKYSKQCSQVSDIQIDLTCVIFSKR